MNINDFILRFSEEFEETGNLNKETKFRELEEWSSMHALLILAMIESDYNIVLTGDEMRACETVEALFLEVEKRKN